MQVNSGNKSDTVCLWHLHIATSKVFIERVPLHFLKLQSSCFWYTGTVCDQED